MKGSNQYIEGKTCVITGATNGIGRVTAVELAQMGAELFLIYRDKVRADETVAEIRNKTGNGPANKRIDYRIGINCGDSPSSPGSLGLTSFFQLASYLAESFLQIVEKR